MLNQIKSIFKKKYTAMICYLAIAVVLVIISVAVLDIPIVAAGAIFVLETLLAASLHQIPIWIHGLLVIAQIVAGILVAKTVFMILMAAIYVCAVALLYYEGTKHQEASIG